MRYIYTKYTVSIIGTAQSLVIIQIYYTAGNVGIGTTNPLSAFHLQGNMLIAGNILPSACKCIQYW
jgi:hypothetical protein